MPVEIDPIERFSTFARPEQVVSPPWLSAHLGTPGLKLIEVDEDSFLYNIGHIPGAIRMDWATDLGDPVTRDFIDGERFAELMRSKGISRDDTVVIYGDQHNWWAAYALWVFELFGHPDVRLLDGGRDAWMGEERDTSFAVPSYPAVTYPVVERDDSKIRTSSPACVNRPRCSLSTPARPTSSPAPRTLAPHRVCAAGTSRARSTSRGAKPSTPTRALSAARTSRQRTRSSTPKKKR